LPGGVTGFATSDGSVFLLNCDRLVVVDENGLLDAASGSITGAYVTVDSSGVFASGSTVSVAHATARGLMVAVAAGQLYIERALGNIYIRKAAVDAWNQNERHCLRVNGQLIAGV